VIPAFGFDHLARVRIFVDLHLARFASDHSRRGRWCAMTGLGIKQINDVSHAVAIFGKPVTELLLEINFLLEATFHCSRLSKLFG